MTQSNAQNDCNCCEGIKKLTPLTIENRSGLSSLSYRVGTHSKFKRSMIAALNNSKSLPNNIKLRNLTTRADDDLSIALFDAWATVSDVLTFYQERIANEGFLRTATERFSILQLARAVGYELRPGVAASTYLAFTIEDSPGAVENTIIESGIKVQSLPIQGKNPPEMPQTFETIETITAYPELNNLKPKLTKPQEIDLNNLSLIALKGTDTKLKIGDGILIAKVSNDKITPTTFKRVAAVKLNVVLQQTEVALYQEAGVIDDYSVQTVDVDNDAIKMIDTGIQEPVKTSQIGKSYLNEMIAKKTSVSEFYAALAVREWKAIDFVKSANSMAKDFVPKTPIKIYAFRNKAGFFGNNALIYNTLPWITSPRQYKVPPYSSTWETRAINTDSYGLPRDKGKLVYLDNTYPKIIPNDWIVLKNKLRTSAYIITNVNETTVADFLISHRSTGLCLDVPGLSPYIFSMFRTYYDGTGGSHTGIYLEIGGFPPKKAVKIIIKNYTLKIDHKDSVSTDDSGSWSENIDFDKLEFETSSGESRSGIIWYPGACKVEAIAVDESISAASVLFKPDDTVSTDIFLNPLTGDSGSKVIITGKNFPQNAKISLFLINDSVKVPISNNVNLKSDGSFSENITFLIPADSFSGSCTIQAVDEVKGIVLAMKPFLLKPLVFFSFRDTTAYVESEELEFAEIYDESVKGDSLVLDRLVYGLQIDQMIVVTGELSNQPGQIWSEVVSIKDITLWENGPFTKITFTPLINTYERKTVRINANIANATHGETKSEILGSGDPSQPHVEFALRQKPLTYVSASTPEGASSTLELRIGDILWKEVNSLYNVGPRDYSFVTRLEDDGRTRVLFGNARLTMGVENVKAKYRIGIGSDGLVEAGQLSLLMDRPLGVRSVTNPTASTGAADPETRDQARKNAPQRVVTLDRIVSVKDCENFALTFAGIGKAKALLTQNGETKRVRLIVASSNGDIFEAHSKILIDLSNAIEKFKDPLMQIYLESFNRKFFSVTGSVWATSDRTPSLVEKAIVKALQAEFSFENRQFGQGVSKSELIASIHRVEGVLGVDIDFLSSGGISYKEYIPCGDVSELWLLNPDQTGKSLPVTLL